MNHIKTETVTTTGMYDTEKKKQRHDNLEKYN